MKKVRVADLIAHHDCFGVELNQEGKEAKVEKSARL
jgi:hypothetical protein